MAAETLLYERVAAESASAPEVLLIHGWGTCRSCWQVLLPELRSLAHVTTVDVPGLGGEGPALELDTLIDALAALAAELGASGNPPVVLGWSLGGQLAMLLAARYPERVTALVTLASNPHFTAAADWPGVEPRHLQMVCDNYRAAPARALRRFEALQGMALTTSAPLRLALADCRPPAPDGLAAGLDWLATLDCRDALTAFVGPQLHLLGECDQLVPPALQAALVQWLGPRDNVEIALLAEVSHPMPLQAPEQIAQHLAEFLPRCLVSASQHGNAPVSDEGPSASEGGEASEKVNQLNGVAAGQLSKAAVAASFSRAARAYDQSATLQRDVGQRLLTRIAAPASAAPLVLDLGCGTAFFRRALLDRCTGATYVGLDLAEGMLGVARDVRDVSGCWVAGDAEQLPLADCSVDIVFSSLAIQWCQQPWQLFAELWRVLKPGGKAYFSTLGPQTLHELRAAWAAVDDRPHVNRFLAAEVLESAATAVGDWQLRLKVETLRLRYSRVRDLIDDLKGIGAHNVNSGRAAGLGGRRRLTAMMHAYEAFREEGALPATYEVYFGSLEKP